MVLTNIKNDCPQIEKHIIAPQAQFQMVARLGRREILLSPHGLCLSVCLFVGLLQLFVPNILGTAAVKSAKNEAT